MLKIAAASVHETLLTEQPEDLRARLQALTGQSFRRINRYIELALYGALRCAGGGVGADTAVYLASEAPMLADCVKALRGVVAARRPPTPFEFMNISGNMAGFYIAQQLGIAGPQLAVHRSGAGLAAALELLALRSAPHRRTLLGYVEEGVWPLAEQRLRLGLAADAPLAECSHWLYLDGDCTQPLATIDAPRRYATLESARAALTPEPQARRVELTQPPLPFTNGAAAGVLARYAVQPDAPLLQLLGRDGAGYTLLTARAGAGRSFDQRLSRP